jgi:hypothetical protein
MYRSQAGRDFFNRASHPSPATIADMAYEFAGFFARPPLPQPTVLPPTAVWREIVSPFIGIGVRLPWLLGQEPTEAEVDGLAAQLGLGRADRWIYLTYDCWGGMLVGVYGMGTSLGQRFGPSGLTEGPQTGEATFLNLMSEFGVSPEGANNFAPFRRGFWDES